MNTLSSGPRLSRGTAGPNGTDATLLDLLGPTLPLLTYLARILNDTMCEHYSHPLAEAAGMIEPDTTSICDRCQRLLYEIGSVIDRSADAVKPSDGWEPGGHARLNAYMALAAAERLRTLFNADAPNRDGASTLVLAAGAIRAARELLADPELGRQNEARRMADACAELDGSVYRAAKARGLDQEAFLIGFVLKAAGKAATAAAHAVETVWAQGGTDREADLAQKTEDTAGAALGAALDGAGALDGTSKASALMAIGTAVANAFETIARPEDRTNGDAAADPAVRAVVRATVDALLGEDDGEVDDFDESDLADVADEAIADAAALAADLQRAEAILTAVATEHRAVETLVRTARIDGAHPATVTEYYQDCCVVCRDAKGRPVNAPCRTLRIVQGQEV